MLSNLSPFSSFTLINRNMIQCIFFCRLVVIYLFIYSFLFCSAVFSCVFSFHSICCYSWDCFGICLYLDNKIQLPYTLIRVLFSCEWRMAFIQWSFVCKMAHLAFETPKRRHADFTSPSNKTSLHVIKVCNIVE